MPDTSPSCSRREKRGRASTPQILRVIKRASLIKFPSCYVTAVAVGTGGTEKRFDHSHKYICKTYSAGYFHFKGTRLRDLLTNSVPKNDFSAIYWRASRGRPSAIILIFCSSVYACIVTLYIRGSKIQLQDNVCDKGTKLKHPICWCITCYDIYIYIFLFTLLVTCHLKEIGPRPTRDNRVIMILEQWSLYLPFPCATATTVRLRFWITHSLFIPAFERSSL